MKVKYATLGRAKSIVMLKTTMERSTETAVLICGWSWAGSTQKTPHDTATSRISGSTTRQT